MMFGFAMSFSTSSARVLLLAAHQLLTGLGSFGHFYYSLCDGSTLAGGASIGRGLYGWLAMALMRLRRPSSSRAAGSLETVASFWIFSSRTGLMQGLRGLCARSALADPLHVQGDTLANVFSRPH